MRLDSAFLWAFFSVFVRASAMMLSSPFFSARSIPTSIRVMATLSIAMALTFALKPSIGELPGDMHGFVFGLLGEAVAGLLIGALTTLAFSAFEVAGSMIDLQMGLGASQILNPVNGVPATLMSQYKSALSLVVFVLIDGHHMLVDAFISSYRLMPSIGSRNALALQVAIPELFAQTGFLALQIAAPVVAVSVVVDAALGLVNKAVPQMPVMLVGMPAKVGLGLVTLSVGLPALVAGVGHGTELAARSLTQVFQGGG
ncbi:MAG: flagellar biosynthetic protein FliR [Armatimonadetes bacterium]|nr:flagellar biosynthetic protein FliR [Armatimonadota bacterium]